MAGAEYYDPQYFADIHTAEQRHFWFRYRNEVIARAARRVWHTRPPSSRRVLEVGCGTGNVLALLERACAGAHVTGMELFPEGLQFARPRTSASLVCGRIEAMPFATPFGLIGLFDVLEHISDDHAALRDLHGVLCDDGALMMTVPAHEALWSSFDLASGHVRRYSRPTLSAVAARAGFRVEYMTEFMLPIAPLVWLDRRVVRRASRADPVRRELAVPAAINAAMLALLRIEGVWLARSGRLPVGTSILAVLRKAE